MMIIERLSTLKLNDAGAILRKAAHTMGATLTHQERMQGSEVFTIDHPGLYKDLLLSEPRFAAFLPCRIAAYEHHGGLKFVTMSPVAFAEQLHHSEVAVAVAKLENVLTQILIDLENLPSTEEQVDMRDTVGERIDERGSKVEDLGGTGEQDSRGG